MTSQRQLFPRFVQALTDRRLRSPIVLMAAGAVLGAAGICLVSGWQQLHYVGLSLIFAVPAGLFAMTHQPESFSKVVETSALLLRAPDGEPRAVFQITDDGRPFFAMKDAGGRKRIQLSIDADGQPGFMVYDPSGKPQVQLASLNNEPATLMYFDKAGEPRLALGYGAQGGIGLMLLGPGEQPRAAFGVHGEDGTPYFSLTNSDESAGITFAAHDESGPAITVSSGDNTVQLRIDDGQPMVILQRQESGPWIQARIGKSGDTRVVLSDSKGDARLQMTVENDQPSVESLES